MDTPLKQLLNDVLQTSGIQQKKDIQSIATALQGAFSNTDHPNGDDAAAIKTENGFDLMAGEGFLTDFVKTDPWFAGWCSVMVNISDIAAMGGYPTAITNTIWSKQGSELEQIYQGMSDASNAFQVPIVGGHTNLQSETTQLAVSIHGKAKRLLSSFAAKPGDVLIAAIDLRGSFRKPFLNWNAATTAPTKRLREDIALLPLIAETNLAIAAKDISQAGILGTCTMLLESSDVGAEVELENIPKPATVSWIDWLCCFPSFGYLLTTPPAKLDELLDTFNKRDIAANCIGEITEHKQLIINKHGQSDVFWDIENQALTGFSALNEKQQIEDKLAYA